MPEQIEIDLKGFSKKINPKFIPLIKDRHPLQIVVGGANSSKCFAKGMQIVMYSGELKNVEDIVIGDLLMGIDSTPRKVLNTNNGYGKLYKVYQHRGDDYTVNENHILCLKKSKSCNRYKEDGDYIEISVSDYLNKSTRWKRNFLGYRTGIDFSNKEVSIDPYYLGLWLGDGDKNRLSITSIDDEIIEYIYDYAKKIGERVSMINKYGYNINHIKYSNEVKKEIANIFANGIVGHGWKKGTLRLVCDKTGISNRVCYQWLKNKSFIKLVEYYKKHPKEIDYDIIEKEKQQETLYSKFVEYNLFYNKHIPNDYLYNSYDIRLKLLAGIIDTDGSMKANCYTVIQKDEKLSFQIKYLANSLGFKCSITKRKCECVNNGVIGDYYSMCISGNTEKIPCRIKRKIVKNQSDRKDHSVIGIDIIQMEDGEYYGFTVDKDNKVLLSDFTITHNSYSYAEKIIYHTIREKYFRCLATRKVKKDVKHSVYDQLREVLNRYKLENYFTYNNTESNIVCKLNGNDILGVGLDDVNKLKSFTNPTFFWAEEADQMTPDDIEQLSLRLRGPDYCFFQGGLTLNPINAQHWIKLKYFDHKNDGWITHHSTYKDNQFLSPKIIQRMEAITDPYYIKVYVNGEWGIFTNGVFSNYIIEDFDYTENDLEDVCYGMDFGFTHAQAIECAGFKDGELYVFDELWEKGKTNNQFMDDAKDYFGDKLYDMRMTCDSADPDKIIEWDRSGFRVESAKKGPGSVRFGIEYLVDKKIHIHESKCANIAKEIQQFRRKEDKNGNVTEDFIEVNDDGIAALRYGTEYIWSNTNQVFYDGTNDKWSLSELGL